MAKIRASVTWRLQTFFLALAILTIPAAAHAQGGYFGRNKVQYRDFKFQVLKTEHFDIHFYPEEEAAARMTARMAERWYARLSKLLNHELRGRQPVILYASAPHFWQTTALEGDMGEGTGGVTEAYKRRIVLPLAGPIHLTDHVFGHELVHAFQYDITNTSASSGNAGALNLPLWFIEGMAEYLSIGPVDPHTSMWMREAARREKLPDIDQLDDPRYFPYRYGQAFWAYVAGRYGDEFRYPSESLARNCARPRLLREARHRASARSSSDRCGRDHPGRPARPRRRRTTSSSGCRGRRRRRRPRSERSPAAAPPADRPRRPPPGAP